MRHAAFLLLPLLVLPLVPAARSDPPPAGADRYYGGMTPLVQKKPGKRAWTPSRYDLAVAKALADDLKKSGRITSLYRSGGCFARLDLDIEPPWKAVSCEQTFALHAILRAAYLCAYGEDAGREDTELWLYTRRSDVGTIFAQRQGHEVLGTLASFRARDW